MNLVPLVALLSVALLLVGLAYLREARLRRALQRLLTRFLSRWSTHHDQDSRTHTAADFSDHDRDHRV